jgi:hypothetical protein
MGRHRARSSPQGPRHSHGRQRWHVSGRTFFPFSQRGAIGLGPDSAIVVAMLPPLSSPRGVHVVRGHLPELRWRGKPHQPMPTRSLCRRHLGGDMRANGLRRWCLPSRAATASYLRSPHAQQTTIFRFSRLAHHANSDLRSPHARTTGATTCLKMTTIFYFSRLPLQRNMQTRDIG